MTTKAKPKAKPKPKAKSKPRSKDVKGNDTTFKDGNPGGPGRAVGSVNKISKDLKRGLIQTAIDFGADGNGKDGLHGFLRRCARYELRAFMSMLSKLVPMEIMDIEPDDKAELTKEEVLAFLRSKGLNYMPIFALPTKRPDLAKQIDAVVIEHQPEQVIAQRKFSGMAPPRDENAGKTAAHQPGANGNGTMNGNGRLLDE